MFGSEPLRLKTGWDFTAGENGDDEETDRNTNRLGKERERECKGCVCVSTTFLALSIC